MYGAIIIRLHVSEVFKGGNHIAVVTHSTVKPMAKILFLLEIFVKKSHLGNILQYVKLFYKHYLLG